MNSCSPLQVVSEPFARIAGSLRAVKRQVCIILVDLHIKTEYNRTNLGWMNARSFITPGVHQSIFCRDRRSMISRCLWAGPPLAPDCGCGGASSLARGRALWL